MNKEMIESENFVAVSTDKGLEKKEKTNNIIKILETENNIEEIEKEKNLEDTFNRKKIHNNISDKYFKKLICIFIPISIMSAIVMSFYNIIPTISALLGMPTIGALITLFVSEEIALRKTEKICNTIKVKQEEFLNEELNKQKQTLKELNNKAVINKTYDASIIGKVQKIKRTKLIDNLKRKLELIKEYQLMKKELIDYSKDHFISPKLRNLGYSRNDIKFIQMLMEQDIKLEDKKQKTLKLEKK